MARAIAVFVLLGLAALLAAWLADHPGDVAIHWQGWRIETSVAVAAIVLALMAFGLAASYRFWLWLRRAPASITRARAAGREQRGYDALAEGLVAVAAGDVGEARRLAQRTEVLLGSPPLALLLSAQSAQLSGDEVATEHHFKAMLEKPETEFLGLRGLLVQASRQGDRQAALKYARRAHALKPQSPWLLDTLFSLQAEAGLWGEAEATLAAADRQQTLDPALARRRRAVTLLGQAQESERQGQARQAAKLAASAHETAADLVPAALMAARLAASAGQARKAAKTLERAWRETPHPELAATWLALWPGDDAARRLRRFRRFEEAQPEHRECRLALADLQVAARRFDQARQELDPLIAAAESQNALPESRICRLMANLEEAENGQSEIVRDWLVKIETAPPEATWGCQGCGRPVAEWTPNCSHCGAFDSLHWAPPGAHHTSTEAPPGAHRVPTDAPPGSHRTLPAESGVAAPLTPATPAWPAPNANTERQQDKIDPGSRAE